MRLSVPVPFETFTTRNIERALFEDVEMMRLRRWRRLRHITEQKTAPKNGKGNGEPDGRNPFYDVFYPPLIPSCPVNAFPQKKLYVLRRQLEILCCVRLAHHSFAQGAFQQ